MGRWRRTTEGDVKSNFRWRRLKLLCRQHTASKTTECDRSWYRRIWNQPSRCMTAQWRAKSERVPVTSINPSANAVQGDVSWCTGPTGTSVASVDVWWNHIGSGGVDRRFTTLSKWAHRLLLPGSNGMQSATRISAQRYHRADGADKRLVMFGRHLFLFDSRQMLQRVCYLWMLMLRVLYADPLLSCDLWRLSNASLI